MNDTDRGGGTSRYRRSKTCLSTDIRAQDCGGKDRDVLIKPVEPQASKGTE